MFIPLALLVLLATDGERAPPADPARFKADLAVLCTAGAKSGARTLKNPVKRAEKIALFLSAVKFGPDSEAFFAELSGLGPDEKPSFLLATAKLAGLSACAFASTSSDELVAAAKLACDKKEEGACDQVKALVAMWAVANKTQARKDR